MEKDIQLQAFDFFKKEPEKIKIEILPNVTKKDDMIAIKIFLGSAVGIMLLLLGAIVYEGYKTNTARERVVHAFISGNIEQDLNQLNTRIKMSKSKDKVIYSFILSIAKLYGLMFSIIQSYEIERTPNSHTLILKDQRLEGIDSRRDAFKELLKNF